MQRHVAHGLSATIRTWRLAGPFGSVQRPTGLQDLDHALSHAVLPHWMLSIAFGSFATLNAAPALLLKKSRILGGVDELVDVARMA